MVVVLLPPLIKHLPVLITRLEEGTSPQAGRISAWQLSWLSDKGV